MQVHIVCCNMILFTSKIENRIPIQFILSIQFEEHPLESLSEKKHVLWGTNNRRFRDEKVHINACTILYTPSNIYLSDDPFRMGNCFRFPFVHFGCSTSSPVGATAGFHTISHELLKEIHRLDEFEFEFMFS
jgi:hypothetical protein